MARPPNPRKGDIVLYKNRPLGLTLFFNSSAPERIMASDIWGLLNLELKKKIKQKNKKEEGQAYLNQAHEFYNASILAEPRSKPLLLYHSFLNFVKMYLLINDNTLEITPSYHGVTEHPDSKSRRKFAITKEILRIVNQRNRINILNEFYYQLSGSRLGAGEEISVYDLLCQIPAIHRTYCHSLRKKELFYFIESGGFKRDTASKEVWATIYIPRSAFSESKEKEELKKKKYFKDMFVKEVMTDERHSQCYCFESKAYRYTRSCLDVIGAITKDLAKAGIMAIVTNNGYRYYVINIDKNKRQPQLIAAYLLMFYFGSIVRYRPHVLESLLTKDKYGWVIKEFLETQGEQFIHIMAAEILEREILKPWANI